MASLTDMLLSAGQGSGTSCSISKPDSPPSSVSRTSSSLSESVALLPPALPKLPGPQAKVGRLLELLGLLDAMASKGYGAVDAMY